jgi:hypothetical protein
MTNAHFIPPTPHASRCIAFPRLYEDTVKLMTTTEHYFVTQAESKMTDADSELRRAYSSEMLRISRRIGSVLEWLVVQNAVVMGKIKLADALRLHPLGSESFCLASNIEAESMLDAPMRELLEESRDLYERIYRLDRQAAAGLL